MTLRYNNQAQLDQFVAAQSGPGGGHQFLTPAQFNSMYAPTAQQEQAVVNALQAAGFTVTHRYSNRTVVDASAPSSVVENFFSTEIHSVQQGKYGQRYTNVKPATVPASIASYVSTASLSNVVIAETKVAQDGGVIRNPQNLDVTTSRPQGPGNPNEAPAGMRVLAKRMHRAVAPQPRFRIG